MRGEGWGDGGEVGGEGGHLQVWWLGVIAGVVFAGMMGK